MNHVSVRKRAWVDHTSTPSPPEEEWGSRGDTSTTWVFEYLTKGSEVPVSFDPVNGKTYYAVIAIYSTGDSFGHDDASSCEVLDIYETAESAGEAIKSLVTHGGKMIMSFTMSNGSTVTNYCPWLGYFDRLNGIEVYPLTYVDGPLP
jgi:hypothetical protein